MERLIYRGKIQSEALTDLLRRNSLTFGKILLYSLLIFLLLVACNMLGIFGVYGIFLNTSDFISKYWISLTIISLIGACLSLYIFLFVFSDIFTKIGSLMMMSNKIVFNSQRFLISDKYYLTYNQVISIEDYPYLIVLITKSKDKNGWRSRLTSKLYLSKSNFINTTPETFIAFMKEKNPSIQVITPNPWWMRLLRKMGKY